MSARTQSRGREPRGTRFLPEGGAVFLKHRTLELLGAALALLGLALAAAVATYHPTDPSWNTVGGGSWTAALDQPTHNLLGALGSFPADLLVQSLGLAALIVGPMVMVWGWRLARHKTLGRLSLRLLGLAFGLMMAALALQPLPPLPAWASPTAGGAVGMLLMAGIGEGLALLLGPVDPIWIAGGAGGLALILLIVGLGLSLAEWQRVALTLVGLSARAGRGALAAGRGSVAAAQDAARGTGRRLLRRREPGLTPDPLEAAPRSGPDLSATPMPADSPPPPLDEAEAPPERRNRLKLRFVPTLGGKPPAAGPAEAPAAVDATGTLAPDREAPPAGAPIGRIAAQTSLAFEAPEGYELPPLDLLALPDASQRPAQMDEAALQTNADELIGVLKDFGVKGEIVRVNPGPVVTLYELEPAPGTKSSRVIGLADDIARSMSAISVRVAVVPGKNAIGIELPNEKRETVFLRELLAHPTYEKASQKLALVLGKDIGGAPVIADLARMPHLLVAGTTGSGKSVAINTMILSLLYRMPPERVRFIMVDPKMLELSIYDGIPHLLSPVVTDPKKAVVALKWTVREMEDRYRAMSKLGVRNVEGYNQRIREAKGKGEVLTRRVQTGFDPDTGKPVFEDQPIDLTELPYIVVVVDEMADLMMVAGKDIEGAIQRLAQMARAAGIHLIMATQRPSVDVITGTIKANFPTRISFQVTSKIDSRTILGEGGAETLLGQGDMLFMAGGGRITRVHGPFVSDAEVEHVVGHLKAQGEPSYNDAVLEEEEELPGADMAAGNAASGSGGTGGAQEELYDRAVALVARERKASTSFVQRHLQIGYNRAARLIERMEQEGVVSQANHVGRREVLVRDYDYTEAH